MAGGDAVGADGVRAGFERGEASAARLRLEALPRRRAPHTDALEEIRDPEALGVHAGKIGVSFRLGPETVMHVAGGQPQVEPGSQLRENIEQCHRVRTARDGHQNHFAAVEHPVAANGGERLPDEASGGGHIPTAVPPIPRRPRNIPSSTPAPSP